MVPAPAVNQTPRRGLMHFPGLKHQPHRQDASVPTIKFHLAPVVPFSLLRGRRLKVSFSFQEWERSGSALSGASLKTCFITSATTELLLQASSRPFKAHCSCPSLRLRA